MRQDRVEEPDPGDALPTLVPLEGGWSGETFLSEAFGTRFVVRIYGGRSAARGRLAPEVDAGVLTLVRGLLPVPEVLEARRADPDSNRPGLLVCSLEPGVSADVVLAGLDAADRGRLGRSLGVVAGTLATMPMVRAAPFVDGDLRLGGHGPHGDLAGIVEARADRLGWSACDLQRLLDVAASAAPRLADVARHSLVHGDLDPANVLLDPATLEVAAVVDWEHAHAGHPAEDLGSLIRFEREPAWVEAVLAGYASQVPAAETADAADLLDRARAADLVALVDLAARRGEGPVAGAAHDLLAAIVRTGDLHASRGAPPADRGAR